MERKIHILFADSTEQKLAEFTSDLKSEPDISLVGQTCDGQMLIDLITEVKPDAVIMGLVLDGIDGLVVLSKLRELAERPIILVYSAWGNMMEPAAALGADFFIMKPCSTKILCERVRQLVAAGQHPRFFPQSAPSFSLESQVTAVLMELGVPSNVRGFKYIRKAVINAVENPKVLEGLTKTLYPSIAKSFDTTSCRVERAIRHAIEVAWERWDDHVLKKYFGQYRFYEKNKPTNGEFIAALCEYILMQPEYRKGA